MSRLGNFFNNNNSTFTVNPINRNTRNYSIEDLNSAIIDDDEKLVFNILESNTISINQTITRDPYRNTLLHTAIEMGNVKIIQKLIDMGADLRITNKKGESCADKLSKSHLGSIIQYISDRSIGKVQELEQEVIQKDSRIRNLEDSVIKLENSNKKLFKEKQDVEVEVVQLRKRKLELEESNTMLRQASKKAK